MRLDKRQHGVNLQVCLTIKLELHFCSICYCEFAVQSVVYDLWIVECCGLVVQIVAQEILNKSNKWSASFPNDDNDENRVLMSCT